MQAVQAQQGPNENLYALLCCLKQLEQGSS